MSRILVFVLLGFSSVAQAREWSVDIYEGSTVGVTFADLHAISAAPVTTCGLLFECEAPIAVAPEPVRPPIVPPAPVGADTLDVYRGVVKTQESHSQRCVSIIQGRLSVSYLNPVTHRRYADSLSCEQSLVE